MNKSLIVVGSIVTVGAIWIGGSWYSGKKIEESLPVYVEKINQGLKNSPDYSGLTLVQQEFKRGFFSSEVSYTLQGDIISSRDIEKLKANEIALVLQGKIDHGPFPLSDLQRFNLLPKMATATLALQDNEPLASWFKQNNGQSPLTLYSQISYSQQSKNQLTLLPFSYKQASEELIFDGAQITIATNAGIDTLQFSGDINGFSIVADGSKISLSDVSLDSELHKNQDNFYVGQQNYTVKQLIAQEQSGGITLLNSKDLQFSNLVEQQTDKLYSINSIFSTKDINVVGQDFGAGSIDLKLKNLDLKGWINGAKEIQQKVLQAKKQPNSEQLTAELFSTQIIDLSLQQLKNNPEISITPLSWKNSAGETVYNLELKLGEVNQDEATKHNIPISLSVLKELKTSLNISEPMISQVVTHALQAQGMDHEMASSQAKNHIDQFKLLLALFKLGKEDNSNITSELHYTDGKINFNGHKMSINEFIAQFASLGEMLE